MVFSSSIFLFLFLPVVLLGYFLAPRPLRNPVLLAASLFFYAWGEKFFVLLMLASISMNYLGGLLIDRTRGSGRQKIPLFLFIAFNLLLLAGFKYANFFTDNLNLLLQALDVAPVRLDPVHLPIGISFFTFQAMSYLVDIYRGDAHVQRNPLNCSLYISLFPQLIAGPIVRYHDIAGQLTGRVVTRSRFDRGVSLFVIGLGKKMLIANPMGEVADQIFALPAAELSTPLAWMGAVSYTLQIYFDFSGYSDMAIGLGRLFGFEFPINFNYPYMAQSFREFWRRWHISLSTWFRDYLYIPLGGNRRGEIRTYVNLVIVFFLCGLWHGASWNFILWGLAHGFFLAAERTRFGDFLHRCWRPLRHTYLVLGVVLTWVVFRSENLAQATLFLTTMAGLRSAEIPGVAPGLYWSTYHSLVLLAGFAGSFPLLPLIREKIMVMSVKNNVAAAMYSLVSLFALVMIYVASAMHMAAGTYNPFIYFRF
jgi:alginate O-acetyltransferase complex protein AlgI